MRWQFWIDVGGTFTDCVAQSPRGEIHKWKTLSSGVVKGTVGAESHERIVRDDLRAADVRDFWRGWRISVGDWASEVSGSESGSLRLQDPIPPGMLDAAYELRCIDEAPVQCIRRLLKLRIDEPIPPVDVRMGTTRGTNALLERKGARTVFVTTQGFGDILLIGSQDRPDLFALNIEKPSPLYNTVIEAQERLAADGSVLVALEEEPLAEQLQALLSEGYGSVAICLLHGYRNDVHERRIEQIACDLGFADVARSASIPVIKFVPRAETVVLDAYLTPILRSYLHSIRSALGPGSSLKVMTSHGGLIDADRFSGKDSILSGPAGGVIAYAAEATRAGFARSIGFDMGGTSTDVSRFGGRFELEQESVKAGVKMAAPMLAIETVAAGGGSICSFDGLQLRVGPESAGADPGPACYGRGGPLTITDVNLALGRLIPERFPFRLDQNAVQRHLDDLCAQIAASPLKRRYAPEELAQGFVEIANETMVRAIRRISVRRGYDPADHALVTFGGAGAQHACAIACALGVRSILVHPLAGVLSAFGMGLADIRRRAEQSVLQTCSPQQLDNLEAVLTEMGRQLTQAVRAEGIPTHRISPPIRSLALRYQGVESTILIEEPEDRDYVRAYEARHQQMYGYCHDNREVEIVTAFVEVVGQFDRPVETDIPAATSSPAPVSSTECWHEGKYLSTPVYDRTELRSGHDVPGPALICESDSTTWVEPAYRAAVTTTGNLLITRRESAESVVSKTVQIDPSIESGDVDPITLEVFNHRFASIAEQMGLTLRKTSVSTNVKERLDYSCALFDAQGSLVVNAPHIPVHLGAMAETVTCILHEHSDIVPGDVFVTNDPYAGGSHLPDVTVVTPVHDPESGGLLFVTASRAHHAEIGGITPGSMPPFSKSLGEEGVVLRHFKLVANGVSHVAELRDLLTTGRFPSRNPGDNLSDITAQVAANQSGARLLLELVQAESRERVVEYMQHIQSAATRKMQRALARIPDGRYARTDWLDDGSPIQVRIDVVGGAARIDFAGTGPVLSTNLNANRAIVTAAVMYSFRCLIDESIPLNSGVLAPLEICLPECLLNPPRHDDPALCPAVVGGNVETSQRIVDVLLGALHVAAASQGTMNNLTFGNESFGYYETVCGGAGATRDHPGADAVHTHMTNTRLTDVEVFEIRYPARICEFRIRAHSGGAGLCRGGNGVVRTFEFLDPLEVSLLMQRRGAYPPFGLSGGSAGAVGRNIYRRRKRPEVVLRGIDRVDVQPGDRLTIETPGGGGYGDVCEASCRS